MGLAVAVLKTVRVHALAFTLGAFLLMGWLGGARGWTEVLIALVAIPYHAAGYSRGAVADQAYDRADPAKAHTPWIDGTLTLKQCWAITLIPEAAFWPIAIYLSWGRVDAILWLVMSVAWGNAYVFKGKGNSWLALLSSGLSYGTMFMGVGTIATGIPTATVLALAGYGALTGAFACSASGGEKELAQVQEDNLLRRLGTTLQAGVQATSLKTWGLFLGMAGVQAALLGLVTWWTWGPGYVGAFVAAAGLLVLVAYTALLLADGAYDRGQRMKVLNVGTALSFLLLVQATAPELPLELVGVLVLGMPALWAGANRLVWRTGSALRYGA